jgi:hypothetical protein
MLAMSAQDKARFWTDVAGGGYYLYRTGAVATSAARAVARAGAGGLRDALAPRLVALAHTEEVAGGDAVGMSSEIGQGAPRVPNPWGRRGSPAHVAGIGEAEARLSDNGWTTVAGGSLPEAKYGARFPDLVVTRAGVTIAIQVGRTTAGGLPVAREVRALADLRSGDWFAHVFFLGYVP